MAKQDPVIAMAPLKEVPTFPGQLNTVRLPIPEGGDIQLTVQGDTSKPAIITYHDIGLEHTACFQNFFNHPHAKSLVDSMCIIHVDAPGQEKKADRLPDGYVYPTLDQLAGHIGLILKHFGLKTYVGIGVGIGANILVRHAAANPRQVDGLMVMACNLERCGWIEWGYMKTTVWQLQRNGMTLGIQDMFLEYWFPKPSIDDPHNGDLLTEFRTHLSEINPRNLSMFIERAISRDRSMNLTEAFKTEMLLVAGHDAVHCDDMEELYSKLDNSRSAYLKIYGTGDLGHEEQPAKVLKAFMLFMQGLGLGAGLTVALNEATAST